jgi:hypothetical protein
VVSGDNRIVHAKWHVAYACPWCDAVVSRPDLLRWMLKAKMLPLPIGNTHALLRVGESIVETNGERDDWGSPMVRSLSGSKWCPLQVPMSLVEVLRN